MSINKMVIESYSRIPVSLLNLAAPIYHILPSSIRYGRTYSNEKRILEDNNKLSVNEKKRKQLADLQRLITYSYKHVPYYTELFDKYGIKPSDIKSIDDISKIPVLTKTLMIKNREKLISDECHKEELMYITTSGSTGTPAGFYVQSDSHMRDLVYVENMFKEYGFSMNSSRLELRGKSFSERSKGKSYLWDAFRKTLSVNIFDLSNESMEEYCRQIERYKPSFAYGYMSAMYALCKYISARKGGLKHKFKAFIGISETITLEQKSFVEEILCAPVLTFYGMSERVIIAKEEHDTGLYYPDLSYGVTELVDSNDGVIKESNISGELVGTSLLNYGMPLIRYKMGDVSSWHGDYHDCVLNPIEGRKNKDVLVNIDGQIVSMASLEIHSDIYDSMFRYQFYQDKIGLATIRVMLNPMVAPSEEFAKRISKTFEERVLGKIKFEIEFVDKIDPKRNGKLSIIDQRLNVDKLNL